MSQARLTSGTGVTLRCVGVTLGVKEDVSFWASGFLAHWAACHGRRAGGRGGSRQEPCPHPVGTPLHMLSRTSKLSLFPEKRQPVP